MDLLLLFPEWLFLLTTVQYFKLLSKWAKSHLLSSSILLLDEYSWKLLIHYSVYSLTHLFNKHLLDMLLAFPGSSVGKKKKILLQCRRLQFNSWVGKIPWRRDRLPTPVFWGFPHSSVGKESASNVGDLGSVPRMGISPGGGMATHSSIFAWKIPMDRGTWWATVHRVAKSWTCCMCQTLFYFHNAEIN